MALVEAVVKNAKPGSKPYKLYDTAGMFLLVHPNGSKYWRLKYRIGDKQKTLAIGVYLDVSLREARDERDEARKLIRAGTDPVLRRKQAKLNNSLAASNTFETVARDWHTRSKGAWIERHANNVIGSLEKDVFPHIGARPIADISAPELLDVLRKLEDRDAPDWRRACASAAAPSSTTALSRTR